MQLLMRLAGREAEAAACLERCELQDACMRVLAHVYDDVTSL